MNRLFLMIGVGIAVVALLFLSQGIKKASPSDADLQKQAQEDAQKNAPPTPPAPPPSAAAQLAASTGVQPSEETVGDPAAARHHISVGWVYDEANQAHPETLATPIQAVRDIVTKSGGKLSAEIVNLDVPLEDRSPAAQKIADLGVSVDSHGILSDNPSSNPSNAAQITSELAPLL